MSTEGASSATGRLKACGRLGTTIRIRAGDGSEVARGIEEIELAVPEGLYAVEWSSAGRRSETLVRVVAGERAVARQSPAEADDPSADAPLGLALESHDRNLWSTGTSRVDKSILVVDVRDRDRGPLGDLMGMIQLGSLDGERDLPGERTEGGGHLGGVVWNEVTPGRYRLRFPSTSGETLDLTVPVLDSRITVVRMVATRATALVQEGDGFVRTPTYGIDPTRTVITTALHSDAGGHARGQQELAETLLRDLASGTSSLSERITGLLEGPGADPLLRVYAAAVVASCLESRAAPALDAPWPETADAQARLARSWCRRAGGWLSGSKRSGMPPDATAILWQIDTLTILHGGRKAASAAKSIQAPTMLECAWRWSIARSTADRNALQGFAGIRAAARSAGGTTPWLCWQGAAAKAVSNQAPIPDAALSQLVSAVAEKSTRLRSGHGGPRGKVPEDLPADVAITALRSEQVMEATGAGRQGTDGTSPAAALSLALTLPQGALGTRLARASEELDRRLAQGASKPAAPRDKDAPGWSRRVLHRDDPNKGRFGGDASAGGYRLTADFAATKGKSWVTIVINVEGPADDGDPVVLYLHDSFKPPRYVERFKGARASLKVTSWGGFTVGAWIRSRRLTLELDLATLPDAPRIVRER